MARFAFILAAIVLVASTISAQEETSDRVYYLDEITVTAEPIIEGNTITQYGDVVTTVSARQIDDLNAQDLPSSLRRVPGVAISRYNLVGNYGGGDGGAVFVRGHGSGRPGAEISTMFDGIPRFSGVWTHPLMDMSSIDTADRIEIMKSAQPVMNGNMAFSAVNIVPKRMTQEGRVTRLHSTFGSFATLGTEFEHGAKLGAFDYYLTLSRRQSDGHRDNADGEVQTIYGRAGYSLDEHWNASLQFLYNDNQARDPLPLNTPDYPEPQSFDNDSRLTIATLEHRHDIFSGSVKAYYDNGHIDWREWNENAGESDHGITNFANYGIRVRETMQLSTGSEIVVGLDIDSYGGSFVDKRPSGYTGKKTSETLSNTAPYLMVSHVFGDDIQYIPSAGVRYNMSSEFDDQTGYQIGQVVRMGRAELHANYAYTFNLPNVWTKVMYSDFWSFANNPDGWQDLDAEYMRHFEIGGAVQATEQVSFDLTYFHDEVIDALRIVLPPPPPPSVRNIGDYITQGIETTVNIRLLDDLNTFLGATFMSTTPDEVPNAPELSLSAGIGYTFHNRIRLNADIQHVAEHYVQGTRSPSALTDIDAYTLLNLRAGYLVPLSNYVGELFVGVENITDETYEFRQGYPLPGRTVLAGIDVRM